MEEASSTRRDALRALILSVAGVTGLVRFLSPAPGNWQRTGGVLSVPESEVPMDGALVLPEARCAIVRDGSGWRAFDLTCTHLGCTVTASDAGFSCPCHGSRFDTAGGVLQGPAVRPLRRLDVSVRGGHVEVRTVGAG